MRKRTQPTFIKSAVYFEDYPGTTTPEVAIAGRSNAGKSSFINMLAEGKIAKVSQTPGKTRLLNFFDFKSYIFVDMPGYGYAARGGDEVLSWQDMIEAYLRDRGTLRGLLLIMDIRRKWAKDEEMLTNFCEGLGIPVLVILNKCDKITKQEVVKTVTKIKRETGLTAVFPCSSTKRLGVLEIEEYFYETWIKNGQQRPGIEELEGLHERMS